MKRIALLIILFWICSLIFKIFSTYDSSVMELNEILLTPNIDHWFGKDDSMSFVKLKTCQVYFFNKM